MGSTRQVRQKGVASDAAPACSINNEHTELVGNSDVEQRPSHSILHEHDELRDSASKPKDGTTTTPEPLIAADLQVCRLVANESSRALESVSILVGLFSQRHVLATQQFA